jgi:prepilin-type N-terminal cleavage/methylation domain-containing protein/prepilin-type processing-associated H-X9-DG protein
MICTIKRGFSLVELLVTLGIISVLLGLVMPAVQQAREAARRTACLNNLRQLSLASQGFLVTKSHFPGPVVNAWPGTAGYTKDAGFLFELLPYLEQSPLHGQFDRQSYLHSIANRDRLTTRVSTLYCPSAGDPSVLSNVASGVSGAVVDGLDSLTCDYSGSGGVWDFFGRMDGSNGGVVRLRLGNQSGTRVAEVRDGLSSTLLAWESAGDGLYLPGTQGLRQTIQDGAPETFYWRERGGSFQSVGRASSLTYLYSWCGFRTGSLTAWAPYGVQVSPRTELGRAVNMTNRFGEPFSFHPGGANFAYADGAVGFLADDIDSALLSYLVSIADGNVVSN